MDEPHLDAFFDPCPKRTRRNRPCCRPRYHTGSCYEDAETAEAYRLYADHLRRLAATMTRDQIRDAMEFHLIAWHVLRHEYNGR